MLPIVDTRVVARHTDGVVISLLRDVSEIPKVNSACELLRSFDIRILGAVMIGVPERNLLRPDNHAGNCFDSIGVSVLVKGRIKKIGLRSAPA